MAHGRLEVEGTPFCELKICPQFPTRHFLSGCSSFYFPICVLYSSLEGIVNLRVKKLGLESPMKMLLGCPAGSDRNQVFTSKLTFKSLYGKTVSFSVLSNLKYFIPRPNKKYLLPRHPEDQFDPLLDLQSARRPIIIGVFLENVHPQNTIFGARKGVRGGHFWALLRCVNGGFVYTPFLDAF